MFFESSKGKKFRNKVELRAVDRESVPYELASWEEIQSSIGKEWTVDAEIYKNYSLVVWRSSVTGHFVYTEMTTGGSLNLGLIGHMMFAMCTVGFNSDDYDIPIVSAMLAGFDCETLKAISDDIIVNKLRTNEVVEKYGFKLLRRLNHYDLQEVAPLSDSLKKYAARMHAKRLQELPYPPEAMLSPQEQVNVREYCFTDNDNTELLRSELREQIELRKSLSLTYDGIELRSKSDAQISESVIVNELTKLTGRRPFKPEYDLSRTIYYEPPAYIDFQTKQMRDILDVICNAPIRMRGDGQPYSTEIAGNKEEGIAPLIAAINGGKYRFGLGGLHSSETSQCIAIKPGSGWGLFDTDFESFYPKMILNNEWYPSHLGRAFLDVFASLVSRRLHAKFEAAKCKKLGDKAGEKAWKVEADSLKITINGSFGKLGSVFSILFSPNLLIQTTITGQLTLMMLIEACELVGIKVVSANTDGFVVMLHDSQRDLFNSIVRGFENMTRLKTEETPYVFLGSRDVNNYIAIKPDGEVKVKGAYSEKGSTGNTRLSKNPEALIVADAIVSYLKDSIPLAKTIRECRNIERFIIVRNVKGGGHINGLYLGKTVRWIYGKGCRDTINYKETGNTVSGSYGAFPLMDLPNEFPANIDHDRYLADAAQGLVDIGYASAGGLL